MCLPLGLYDYTLTCRQVYCVVNIHCIYLHLYICTRTQFSLHNWGKLIRSCKNNSLLNFHNHFSAQYILGSCATTTEQCLTCGVASGGVASAKCSLSWKHMSRISLKYSAPTDACTPFSAPGQNPAWNHAEKIQYIHVHTELCKLLVSRWLLAIGVDVQSTRTNATKHCNAIIQPLII